MRVRHILVALGICAVVALTTSIRWPGPGPAGAASPTATPTPTPTPAPPTPTPSFPNLDGTVSVSEFIIPGIATSMLASKVTEAQSAPFTMFLVDDVASLFPKSGEILVGKTELMVYDNNACATPTPTNTPFPPTPTPTPTPFLGYQLCVTERAKVGQAKQHDAGTQAKLATQLTAEMPAKAAHTTLLSGVSDADTPPFAIKVADAGNFPAAGYITISHSRQRWELGANPQPEYFQYDNYGLGCAVGPNELCVTARALQPGNEAYGYPEHAPDPSKLLPVHSYVDLHVQAQVKSNAGFFRGNLLVYDVDPGNEIVGAELMAYDNLATKIKSPSSTEIHITSRGGSASPLKPTDIVQHDVGSIVTGPDSYLVCRNGLVSPMPVVFNDPPCDAACQANSVGNFSACYSQLEPSGAPKTLEPKELLVPLVGQSLIWWSAWGQPFLSTGGFTDLLYGEVPLVDSNGTKDGILNQTSACVINYVPGVNLQIELSVMVDGYYATVDTGTITVTQDTIHDAIPDNGDECDDPAGTGDITVTTYIYPGDEDMSDDDTDGDGCTDDNELQPDASTGGLRDPWNFWDFYDVNHDGVVTVLDDIIGVAARFGATGDPNIDPLSTPPAPPAYHTAFDRGESLGPFNHNRSGPNGSISSSDIFAVAAQFGSTCP